MLLDGRRRRRTTKEEMEMAQPQHGGARAPDRKPRPPAGPGRFANRQDLSQVTPQQQPLATPKDLPYGDVQRMMQAQKSAPVPRGTPSPAPPAAGGQQAPAGGMMQAPSLADLLSRPTDRPTEPVTAGLPIGGGPAGAPKALAFKVDVLSYMATLPFAGQEITTMLRQAQQELAQSQMMSLPGAPPPKLGPPAPPPVASPIGFGATPEEAAPAVPEQGAPAPAEAASAAPPAQQGEPNAAVAPSVVTPPGQPPMVTEPQA